jgi:hypothetical protein
MYYKFAFIIYYLLFIIKLYNNFEISSYSSASISKTVYFVIIIIIIIIKIILRLY